LIVKLLSVDAFVRGEQSRFGLRFPPGPHFPEPPLPLQMFELLREFVQLAFFE
jgi:hypothetical protein